ncbi:NUDIX domain-containing protein [Thermoplasmatales archaeon AK]|nr:NUDIX domain-containing protein [Thermoplasmatales archaeon AK]
MIPAEKASVGILLHGTQRDPWSGNIALPGGHSEDSESSVETLIREVREETNIRISRDQVQKQLVGFTPNSRPRLVVYPFVVQMENYDGASPGPEIQEIRIVDLNQRKTGNYSNTNLPAFIFGDLVVWGLTYRILRYFIQSEWNP